MALILFISRYIDYALHIEIDFPVVVMEHVPMVMRSTSNADQFEGVEVEIVRALGNTFNFKPNFYATSDSETERWGRVLPNGTFSGLVGQMVYTNILFFNIRVHSLITIYHLRLIALPALQLEIFI